mgnify:CR=1 FL=1
MPDTARQDASATLIARYQRIRAFSEQLCAPLLTEDMGLQACADVSPPRWHLAHTTWFFETFVLRDHAPRYRPFDQRYAYLFNSYYEAEGPRHARPMRGMLTRPALSDIMAYRAYVDAEIEAILPNLSPAAQQLVTLGLHHEQQHQELMLTDLLHLFSLNPLEPALFEARSASAVDLPGPLHWIEGREGLAEIGDDGRSGFAFDCEGPRHRALLPVAIVRRQRAPPG